MTALAAQALLAMGSWSRTRTMPGGAVSDPIIRIIWGWRLNSVFSEFCHSERKDHVLINNRQAGRRNRGRNNNNGRPSGNNNRGGGDNGNRIDNRSRGNATQLLEKYKNMARDAQMVGDRVNAEYYLQFADHYFRVLADNRARQEEQQQRYRPRDENFDEDGDDFDNGYDGGDDFRTEQPVYDRTPREQAPRDQVSREQAPREQASRDQDRRSDEGRDNRDTRGEGRGDREARDYRGDNRDARDGNRNNARRERPRRDRFVAQEMGVEGPTGNPAQELTPAPQIQPEPIAAQAAPEAEAEAPRPRRGRPRKVAAPAEMAEAFDAAVLPPSIARADNDAEPAAEDAPKKRTRRPRAATTEAAE
jgi:hypothetical protein